VPSAKSVKVISVAPLKASMPTALVLARVLDAENKIPSRGTIATYRTRFLELDVVLRYSKLQLRVMFSPWKFWARQEIALRCRHASICGSFDQCHGSDFYLFRS